MTTSRVLCLSTDEAFASHISAPLEYSYPEVSVLTVSTVAEGIEVLDDEHVDAVVSDFGTASAAPGLMDAIRSRRPDLSLLLLSTDRDGEDSPTAVAEVVDFLDGVGTDAGDEALAGWVANSVVAGGDSPTGPDDTSRLEELVHSVKRALVDATDPVAVEAAVCERLVVGDRYEFAWIGEYDRGEAQVVPWATAASGTDWPRTQTFPVDGSDGVVAQTLRSREPVVLDDVGDHLDPVPWRDVAVERGCTGAIFVPLYTEEDIVGVMGVYTTDRGGFSEAAVDATVDVADTTARVLQGMAIRGRIDQQERTLRRYRRLVATVGDGMYALDDGGHFMTVNDALCSMTGYAREGLLGEHVGLVLTDAGRERWNGEVQRLREAGIESGSIELSVRRKDGTEFPCENKVALLPSDADGGFRGTVGVVRDITERKQRERELRRQNERLDAFASIVSHDLRNPLSVAQGYLEMVGEEVEDPGRGAETPVQRVSDALDRMNEMIDDVLALARSGESVTDTTAVRIGAVGEDAWENVDTDGATIEVDDPPVVRADRSRLLRLFENLFRNAMEHGGRSPTVTVGSLDSPGGGFYVEDDGPGMAPDVRDRVFEADFTTSEEGHGIGLWVVGEVADAHGWTPTATVGSDGGARFEFAGVESGE